MYLLAHKYLAVGQPQAGRLPSPAWKSTTSGYCSPEEYSHVISFKGPSWSSYSNAAGNDCFSVCVWHTDRSSGRACSEVGALWRIFFPLSRRGYPRYSPAGIGPVDEPSGIKSARSWPECYLQLQPLVWFNARHQHSLGQRRIYLGTKN